jgi:hypothetical protein
MLVPAAPLVTKYSTCLMLDDAWLPEPEAAQFVRTNRLRGRMLTFFDWGQYAIWHLAPDVKVSMDGRRETIYSDEMIWGHWRFYAAESTAIPFVQALNPDYVWVPQRRPIAQALPAHGWTPVFRGPVSVIFARDASQSFQQVDALPRGTRCFPGP